MFTARKRSCGKVMFLHLSVILFTGGRGVWLCVQGGVCGSGSGVCLWVRGSVHPLVTHTLVTPPGHQPLDTYIHTHLDTHTPLDIHPPPTTVNKRVVSIILECILVVCVCVCVCVCVRVCVCACVCVCVSLTTRHETTGLTRLRFLRGRGSVLVTYKCTGIKLYFIVSHV